VHRTSVLRTRLCGVHRQVHRPDACLEGHESPQSQRVLVEPFEDVESCREGLDSGSEFANEAKIDCLLVHLGVASATQGQERSRSLSPPSWETSELVSIWHRHSDNVASSIHA